MRVIFIKDVSAVGRRHEVKEVSDGYARNFLFPKKLARPATEQALRELKDALLTHAKKTSVSIDQAEAVADRLAGIRVIFRMKADEKGKTFGSITKAHIAKELAKHNIGIEKDDILLPEPIKTVGEATVHIALHPNLTVPFAIRVEAESKKRTPEQTRST